MQGLYAIVNVPEPHGHGVAELTRAVLAGRGRGGPGASVVQLRAKHASTPERITMLDAMAPICAAAGAQLYVNDDLEAALASSAGGLHVGQGDPGADDLPGLRARATSAGKPNLRLGLSTHDSGQLVAGCRQRPDYVALGPIAPTTSKVNPDPVVGFPGLLEGCRLANRPLVAIGGLDRDRGVEAIGLGAAAVAMIGALQHEDLREIEARAADLAEAFTRAAAPLPFDRVCAEIPILPPEQLLELAKWSDDLSVHIGLGLPARFGPRFEQGAALYRPCDLLDLLYVLDKRADESWDAWKERGGDVPAGLVQLRR
ncbi:MAG: thiamine phosphate synthase [Myxococcota bacterium]